MESMESLNYLKRQKMIQGITEYIKTIIIGEVIIEEQFSVNTFYKNIIIYIKNNFNNFYFNYSIEKDISEISKDDIDEILSRYKQDILKYYFF